MEESLGQEARLPLDQTIITHELGRRTSRSPDFEGENQALRDLVRELSLSPETILQCLVEKARLICNADSAGISIAETDGDHEIFRWHAVTGRMKPFYRRTMQRHFSPCGVVLEQNAAQLMNNLVGRYEYMCALEMPFHEVLLVPFHLKGKPAGTIWVVAHGPDKKFDAEDSRVMHSLAEFTATAVETRRKISELAQGRNELNEYFMQAPVPMCILMGPEQVYTLANAPYLNLVERDVLGKKTRDVFTLEEATPYFDILDRVYRTGEPHIGKESFVPFVARDGISRARYVDYLYHPFRDGNGVIQGIQAIVHDVTEHVEIRKKLEASEAELEEERDLREHFVEALTHDLCTPMAAARLSAQLVIRKAGDPDTVQTMSQRIISNIDRAVQMTRDLLDANRIKAGEGIPISAVDCRLDEVVHSVVQDLQSLHGPRFQVRNGGGDILGHWDSPGLRRVIENLASNAIKYGAPYSPITISLNRCENWAEIEVHNEGRPIAAADQKLLFRPYRRITSVANGAQQGWGIGLSLVKGIVNAHGGTARVESSEKDGTTFFVRLPLEQRAAPSPLYCQA